MTSGQLTLPFDNVDEEYLNSPKKLNIESLKNFMLFMGPLSSCFDMIVFASIWFIFGIREAAIFQTIWFSYGVVSNLVGMHIIRTAKKPFIESNASPIVYGSSILLSLIAIIVPFTSLRKYYRTCSNTYPIYLHNTCRSYFILFCRSYR